MNGSICIKPYMAYWHFDRNKLITNNNIFNVLNKLYNIWVRFGFLADSRSNH